MVSLRVVRDARPERHSRQWTGSGARGLLRVLPCTAFERLSRHDQNANTVAAAPLILRTDLAVLWAALSGSFDGLSSLMFPKAHPDFIDCRRTDACRKSISRFSLIEKTPGGDFKIRGPLAAAVQVGPALLDLS
jgi:hypothetical protein